MAIPRSPAIDRSAAVPTLPASDDVEDSEGFVPPDVPQTPDVPRTPEPSHSNGGRQVIPPPPEGPEAELARVRQELRQAHQHIAALQRAASVTPSPETFREPKVNKPAEFSGKLSEYSTFISQCLLIFSMCPISYAKDEQKVLFVITYLAGTPRGWARSILENPNHPYRNDFAEFKKALDAMYADRNLKQRALDKLGHLEQTKSVASYSAEFQHTIAPLNLDDSSKQSMFYRGLSTGIKKSLIYFQPAKTFEELLEQCVSVDQRQYALRQEEKQTEKSSKPHSKSSGNSSNNFKKPSQPGNHSQSGSTPKYNQPKQPSGPHDPVSNDEKNYRQENNLCFRCGSPKHRIVDCPLDKGRVPNHPVTASNAQTSNAKAPEYCPSFPLENWPSQGTSRPVP